MMDNEGELLAARQSLQNVLDNLEDPKDPDAREDYADCVRDAIQQIDEALDWLRG